ncbi:MAG: serpin family protein [Alphaproteobacteria bacterium]|nr:serpin family protein [Alphaproteobacteria bacterium]
MQSVTRHLLCGLLAIAALSGPLVHAADAGEGIAKDCGAPQLFEGQNASAEIALAKAGFAINLVTGLSSPNQNVAVSPFGLSAVLATLDLGADPSLRNAIAATLHLSRGAGRIGDLRAESRLINLAVQRDSRRFASFNALLVDHRLPLRPGIRDLALSEGNILLQPVDFGSQQAIDGLNAMLSAKTGGRIRSFLEPGSAPSLVAVNALVFRDCWQTGFDVARTAERPFTREDGSTAFRTTMAGTINQARYRAQNGFVAVELPYLDENFVLTLVTTARDAITKGEFKEAAALLAGLDFTDVKATLALPKFESRSDNDLLGTLAAMGLKTGLASANQLPGFADGLEIGRVRQKTWLVIDEAGSEAASLTAAEATRSTATGPKEVSVNFDRPFIYALRYRPTGAILIAGYVADPAPAAPQTSPPPPSGQN